MPLTIFFSSPGIYTIEDDGIRGNGTSVVKDSNGTVLFPFVHPADTIAFIAEVPGVTFVFNTADSFGTANVTVGSLTDTALTPDAIVVKSMRTDAFLTLVANGTITEGGSDAAADLTAAGLILSAGSGIGSPGNAIETQVTFIEAETTTGGINIANSGSVQVGGLTPDVAGFNVVTSGNINFSTTGFILLADSTGASTVHGGETSGNVTLTALGADADIFTNIDQPAVAAAGGGITLNAGRDIGFGTSGTNFNNDVLATGAVRINAGRDFVLDGTSNVRTGAFGGVFGGAIDIQAGRNIVLSNATGGLQTIQAFAGDITLTTGPGGAFIENAMLPGAVQTSEDIVLNADNVIIASGGLNNTGIGSVTIRPVSAGRAIDLGSTLDSPGTLGLSDAEFDRLYTLNVNIGDAKTGPVVFSAPLTPFIVDNLTVRSGTEILVNSSIALQRSLALQAGDDIVFTASGSFTGTNGGFTGYVDYAQDDDGAGGFGSLGGTLTVSAPIQLVGNVDRDTLRGSGGNDILDGRGGADTLIGALGDDWYYVDNAADVVIEAVGEGANDRVFASVSYALAAGVQVERMSTSDNLAITAINLTGNEIVNLIYGNAGANVLDGRGGADTMVGFEGDDRYYVDNIGDLVNEGAGGGTLDRVLASVSYTLGAGVQVEMLTTSDNLATTAINLTGNELVNTIFGNAGANVIDGKGGADSMIGFGGDDWFFVDNAADSVNEGAGGGINDRVSASVSYTLAAGVQVEILSTSDNLATTAINLTGNELVNTIFGNAGANILDGKAGADSMIGFGGDDRYFVDNIADSVNEGAGGGTLDRVLASVSYVLAAGVQVEMMTTVDNFAATAINLRGNELGNAIFGNAGINVLDGGGGADSLTGFGGADTFRFTSALGAGNVDSISDYNVADDGIQLDDAVFTGLATGALAAGAFRTGAAAADADDRIIYNSATGALLFDADGVGGAAAVQFATIAPGLAMAASEFFVI